MFELRKMGVLSEKVRLMEFGEQNWFGDVGLDVIVESAKQFLSPEEVPAIAKEVDHIANMFDASTDTGKSDLFFQLAAIYYRTLFKIERHDAVDLHGTPRALKYDLNNPLPITDTYNMVLNFGTGEHVFNQYSFFKNMHDVTEVGGLMLHSMPNQGCYDHGFYNYHPTFVFDLMHFNQYEVNAVVYGDMTKTPAELVIIDRVKYVEMAVNKQLSNYSALLVCCRKTSDAAFVVPQQGYYGDHLPEQLRAAWNSLSR